MFEDFDKSANTTKERQRTAVSATVSLVVFALVLGGLAAAIATARAVVSRPDREVEVEFASLPQAELEPPPPPAAAQAPPPPRATKRRRARNVMNRPPREIPDQRPAEAAGELIEASDVGVLDGFTDGGGDLTPDEPPVPAISNPVPSAGQRRETITGAQRIAGCTAPIVPAGLRNQAETIRVEVRLLIGEDGQIRTSRILQAHPLIPDGAVLACAQEQTFEPARLPDGTRIPYPYRLRFVFRPSRT